MELTKKQRKYLGLELIEPNWERVEIPNNSVKPELSTGKEILFFDDDVLRKVISLHNNGHFCESSYSRLSYYYGRSQREYRGFTKTSKLSVCIHDGQSFFMGNMRLLGMHPCLKMRIIRLCMDVL